jgi:hypothetical protein
MKGDMLMLGSFAPLGISLSVKSILLTLILSVWGCTYGSYSERYPFQSGFDGGVSPSFWTQKVLITGWGFTMATPYGPFNIGYLQWQRNIDQPKEPAKPTDAIAVVPR